MNTCPKLLKDTMNCDPFHHKKDRRWKGRNKLKIKWEEKKTFGKVSICYVAQSVILGLCPTFNGKCRNRHARVFYLCPNDGKEVHKTESGQKKINHNLELL